MARENMSQEKQNVSLLRLFRWGWYSEAVVTVCSP